MDSKNPGEDRELIFVKYFTTKNGKRIYAHEKGLEAFPIWVKRKSNTKNPDKGESDQAG